jgi:hypothetical protein
MVGPTAIPNISTGSMKSGSAAAASASSRTPRLRRKSIH